MSDSRIHIQGGYKIDVPLIASETVYKGDMVTMISGYAEQAVDTGSHLFVGIATEQVTDATGVSGSTFVKVVAPPSIIRVKSHTDISATSVGAIAHVKDEKTVQLAAGSNNDVIVGLIVRYFSTSEVLINTTIKA